MMVGCLNLNFQNEAPMTGSDGNTIARVDPVDTENVEKS